MARFLDAWTAAHTIRDIASEVGEIAFAGYWLASTNDDGATYQSDSARRKIDAMENAVARLKAALEPALSPQSEDLKS